jgi:hypothetical protein
LLGSVMKFRKQLTVRTEFRQQSGWNTQMNEFMIDGLKELDAHIRRITYNPDATALDKQKEQAADTTRTPASDFTAKSLNVDNVLPPAGIARPIVHTLDGSDPNVPQPDPADFPNDHGRLFISTLDNFFVTATRLDSRFDPDLITKYEAAMMLGILNSLYTITQVFGGESNRVDTPTGTLPADDPKTFNAAGVIGAK